MVKATIRSPLTIDLRSSVVSKLISNGCDIAGKNGPKENSWIMCERFITVVSFALPTRRAIMIGMLIAHVAMAKSRDVKIRSNFLDLYTAVYSTRGSIRNLVMRGPVSYMMFLCPCGPKSKELANTFKATTLVRRFSSGRRYDFGCRCKSRRG